MICFLKALYLYEYTSLTLSHCTEVPMLCQESGRSCICVLGISNVTLSTIFLLNFGTVTTMWYFFDYHLIVGCEKTCTMMHRLLLLTSELKFKSLKNYGCDQSSVIKTVKMKYNRFHFKWWRVSTSFKIHF